MSLVTLRKLFPYFSLALLASAMIYATSFGTLPRADLIFNNATEIKTVDPPLATGVPEGRIISALFEGLLQRLPEPGAKEASHRENMPFSAQPAVAERYEVSDDGRIYTFHLRPTARWSDDTPVTAHDFTWSWQRMLHPDTASEYAYQLFYIQGARQYTEAVVAVGDAVEIELPDRPKPTETFPRGTILRGKLERIIEPDKGSSQKDATYLVLMNDGKRRAFCRKPSVAEIDGVKVEAMRFLLPDFEETVGITAVDDHTFVVILSHSTPYFPELAAFYPMFPVNRKCVETYGAREFTKPENLVCNGAYKLQFRRIRDRIRLVKNPHYWNAEKVQLDTIDALAIQSDITALNLYETGEVDLLHNVPATVIPQMKPRDDFYSAPQLTVYFYRVNTTRPALNDKRIRQALCRTIDRAKICEKVLQAGEMPYLGLVPPGMSGYSYPQGFAFDVEAARKLLAEAGFPEGRGLPKIEILYNTHETHQAIAEVIQADWKRFLNIEVELRGLEWGTYLDHQQKLEYQVSRAAWTADYPDPNTYIDMFVTGGANNQTGWSNARYDELVQKASSETDVAKRMQILHEAEVILLDELPILPIYAYVSKFVVKPHVLGVSPNSQDLHPLHLMHIDRKHNATGTSK